MDRGVCRLPWPLASPGDEVRAAAGSVRQGQRTGRARLLLLLNVISDRIAAEAQLTEEESIEFGSDITIILSLVYKHGADASGASSVWKAPALSAASPPCA